MHPAEVFALAVAVAAVIQSVVFIGVQSTTLASTWATGCELTAQLLWPGITLRDHSKLSANSSQRLGSSLP